VPVPLKSVSVKTKIVDFVAEVTIEQKYVNQVTYFNLYSGVLKCSCQFLDVF